MKYTGLKDKNREEVFEGDLINVTGYGRNPLIVEYKQGAFGFTLNFFKDFCAFRSGPFLDKGKTIIANIEVIGNIYENPDLMKKTTKN